MRLSGPVWESCKLIGSAPKIGGQSPQRSVIAQAWADKLSNGSHWQGDSHSFCSGEASRSKRNHLLTKGVVSFIFSFPLDVESGKDRNTLWSDLSWRGENCIWVYFNRLQDMRSPDGQLTRRFTAAKGMPYSQTSLRAQEKSLAFQLRLPTQKTKLCSFWVASLKNCTLQWKLPLTSFTAIYNIFHYLEIMNSSFSFPFFFFLPDIMQASTRAKCSRILLKYVTLYFLW